MVNCGKNVFGDETSKMSNIIETFTIPVTEWKTVDAGKNTIRIKGVALKGDVVSKNLRHYLTNEVRKSTNTFIGKPINIHHNNPKNERTNIGNLTWMDWDETAELLTYEGEITKQPYVDMLRNKSTEIRGVSVQAKFLHNKCPDCTTHPKFFTEESFRDHMWTEHFKKVSAVPHGIIGEAITLVLSPEVPGYDGTTVDLAETARRETLRLLETVIKTEQEKEEYKLTETSKIKATIAVTPRAEIAVGSVKEIVEPPTQKPEIPKQVTPVTPPLATQKPVVTNEPLPSMSPPKITEVTLTESIIIKPAETITLKETVAIGKLKLTEEECTPFEQCLKDGGTEEECARKVKETRIRNSNNKAITETLNAVIEVVSKPITLTLPEVKAPAPYNDKPIKEALAAIPQDDLGWKEIKIPIAYNDKPLKEALEANEKTFKENMVKFAQDWDARILTVLTEQSTIKETIANQKKDFDNLLDSADKAVKEHFAENKQEMTEKDKQIKELTDKLEKSIKETAEAKTLAETAQENVQDLRQPSFKAHAKTSVSDNKPVLTDPMKSKEKS